MPEELFVTIYTGPGRGHGKMEGRVACGCFQAAGVAIPAPTFATCANFSEYKAVWKLENFVRRSV